MADLCGDELALASTARLRPRTHERLLAYRAARLFHCGSVHFLVPGRSTVSKPPHLAQMVAAALFAFSRRAEHSTCGMAHVFATCTLLALRASSAVGWNFGTR